MIKLKAYICCSVPIFNRNTKHYRILLFNTENSGKNQNGRISGSAGMGPARKNPDPAQNIPYQSLKIP
jgi:hypothetical protein